MEAVKCAIRHENCLVVQMRLCLVWDLSCTSSVQTQNAGRSTFATRIRPIVLLVPLADDWSLMSTPKTRQVSLFPRLFSSHGQHFKRRAQGEYITSFFPWIYARAHESNHRDILRSVPHLTTISHSSYSTAFSLENNFCIRILITFVACRWHKQKSTCSVQHTRRWEPFMVCARKIFKCQEVRIAYHSLDLEVWNLCWVWRK